jgi:phage shock protein A
LTYAEVKAIASGNPLVIEKASVDAEITRLTRLRSQHGEAQYRIRSQARHFKEQIPLYTQRIENLKLDKAVCKDTRGDAFEIEIAKTTYKDRGIAGELINRAAQRAAGGTEEQTIGHFAGFQFCARPTFLQRVEIVLKGKNHYVANVSDTPLGTIRSVEYTAQNMEEKLQLWHRDLAEAEKNSRELEAKIGQPFEHESKLQSLVLRQQELENALDITKNQASNTLSAEESNETENAPAQTINTPAHVHAAKTGRKSVAVKC